MVENLFSDDLLSYVSRCTFTKVYKNELSTFLKRNASDRFV